MYKLSFNFFAIATMNYETIERTFSTEKELNDYIEIMGLKEEDNFNHNFKIEKL